MNRRTSLKTLGIVSGGLVSLPAWAQNWSVSSIGISASSFSDLEKRLISAVVGTIIPDHDNIGALALGVDTFLIRLFDQCYEKEVVLNIKTQLITLNQKTLDSLKVSFPDAEQIKREEIFLTFNNETNADEKSFYDLMKSETVRGFRTSKVIMREYYDYKVAPGHYYGCVDITKK